MEITSVVFDMGGVLFRDGTKAAIENLKEERGIDEDLLVEIFYGNNSWQLRAGRISSFDYWAYIYERYPAMAGLDLKGIWYDSFVPNFEILDAARKLSRRLVVGIVSGNIIDRVLFLENKYKFLSNFEFKIFSFNTGFQKRDIETYKLVRAQLQLLNLRADESLIIDDNDDCIQAAKAVGFRGMVHKGSEIELCTEINKLGYFKM